MRKFGLIGKNISYSFSQNYFTNKFTSEEIIDASYQNFDLSNIEAATDILENTEIKGLNVTIPYKEAIIPYLDKLDKKAKKIGAVNTIKRSKKGKLVGYNTDYYGFKKSLKPLLKPNHKNALILGTGGASKAVAFTLDELDIAYKFVSRTSKNLDHLTYSDLNESIINNHQIIINCTPLGTFPNITEAPNIPYESLTEFHILYDLIYNPEETTFLKHGRDKNATTINGLPMLKLQAEKAWRIWNKNELRGL
ncbi:shikimate dehydrogenase [Bizionia argentinensis JUB59]|uniref:Shikimate dehydrogenase n=1 Tax=Bizionia argentinensis JUB59 TaxID=1046627 RepID=G2E8Y5_9FLAO|nr:shikimate dehydrogenase [Bizionia argentinensis]EGV45108.1 shikimate dehydrogenase [Bizionia argentinensis JUB59]